MSQRGSASDGLQPDPLEIRRRRLLFRCWHRGTQEIDLLLGSFAEASLAGFDSAQLGRFEALLDCPDADVRLDRRPQHAAAGVRPRRHAHAALLPPPSEEGLAMERPLSPFMFPNWYRFQITSALSILHRLTGIALTVGSILLAWWIVSTG
jgi:hypothetical protein